MANSLIVGCLKMGMKVAIASPKGYEPDKEVLEFAKGNPDFLLTTDIFEAAKDADAIYTDVWSSMGMEAEIEERKKAFKEYQVDSKLMSYTHDKCLVLHCLPAHRGEEITEDVFEKHADEIFEEAENRLHAQKAVLVKLLGNK
jgi:ornithine carbamoyltransferase